MRQIIRAIARSNWTAEDKAFWIRWVLAGTTYYTGRYYQRTEGDKR